ncbi:7141_t:CDS:2, partial [Ambispora gerdemannii]
LNVSLVKKYAHKLNFKHKMSEINKKKGLTERNEQKQKRLKVENERLNVENERPGSKIELNKSLASVSHEHLEVKNERLKVEIERLKVEIERLKVENERFGSKIELNKSLASVSHEHLEVKNERLKVEIERLKVEIERLKVENERFGSKIELNKSLASVSHEHLEVKNARLEVKNERLKVENERFGSKIELNKSLASVSHEHLEVKNARLVVENELLKVENESLKLKNKRLELAISLVNTTHILLSVSHKPKDANINKYKVNFSEEMDYNLSSSFKATTNTVENENNLNLSSDNDDEIKNQSQQINTEQLGKSILDDLLTLFKYNENDKEYLEKLTTIKSLMSFNKIQFLRDNIRYRKILGFIYHFGINSKIEALKWFQLSAKDKNTRARFILSKLSNLFNNIELKDINIQNEKIKLFHGITDQEFQIIQSSLPAIKNDSTPLLEITTGKSFLLRRTTTSELSSLSQGITKEQNSIQESFINEAYDEAKTNNIYFEILSEQLSIVFDFQTLKPTENLCLSIQKALKSNTPIENLKHVFQIFGHYFHTKIIFGNKLQRNVQLSSQEMEDETKKFDDFSEIDPLLKNLRELDQSFDSSYMIAMDGYPKRLSQISEWLDTVLHQESEWYIENFVLMFNTTSLLDYDSEYQRIEYDSQLKSNTYQLFGNVVTCSEEKLESVYVKFSMKTKFGFSVSWHDFRQDYIQADDKSNFDSARRPYKLRWMLIGCPSEIGYFDPNTRDISVNIGFEELKLTHDLESVKIDVGKSLFQQDIVAFDIEYASLPSFLFFHTNIEKWQESGTLKMQIATIEEENKAILTDEDEEAMLIDENEEAMLIDEDEDFTITVRWCVLNLKKNSEVNIWNQLGKLGEFLE